jgi:hypothetical protein
MGMDGVEIVMAVEDAFDITIADKEAEKIVTPRDLIELVMAKVRKSDMAVCLTQWRFPSFAPGLHERVEGPARGFPT